MIYVTGDTHINHDIYKLELFAKENPHLSKNDYIIIAGDFGGVFDERTLKKDLLPYQNMPCMILFVDGNHENFNMLEKYEITMWNGGKVHIISENIIHLMRGQVYNIEGKTFFTFGGATSTDKEKRIENFNWWPQEVPTYEDFDKAIENLKKVNNNVDYIISHSCDEKALYYPPLRSNYFIFNSYFENQLLSYFEDNVTYKHWYFGHYHIDGDINEKKTVLFQKIIKL